MIMGNTIIDNVCAVLTQIYSDRYKSKVTVRTR